MITLDLPMPPSRRRKRVAPRPTDCEPARLPYRQGDPIPFHDRMCVMQLARSGRSFDRIRNCTGLQEDVIAKALLMMGGDWFDLATIDHPENRSV